MKGRWLPAYEEGERVVAWVPDDLNAEHRVVIVLASARDASIAAQLLNALDATPAQSK